jgi:hypothetical protein
MKHTPNQRSTYAKVRTILGCAHSERERLASLDDLVHAVENSVAPSFTYFRARSRRGGSEVVPCSLELVRARISLCVELGLLHPESGRLTRAGQDCLKAEGVNRVLIRQVRQLLEKQGFNFGTLHSQLRPAPDGYWLPTAQRLYDESPPNMKVADFRRMLNLLVESGYLRAVQSRVYLPAAPLGVKVPPDSHA